MSIWEKIKNFFRTSKSLSFLKRFLRTRSAELVDEIGDIAYTVVRQVEYQAAHNGGIDKFELAKSILIQELGKRAGLYSIMIIETVIQLAVALLKENGEEIKKR